MIFDQNRGSERSWTNIDPVGVTILLPSEDFVLLNHSTFKPFECYSDRLLVRQLLAYAGRGEFTIKPVSLPETARKMTKLLQSSIPSRVDLRFDIANNVPPVAGDPSQIQQVLMNLIINAAEAIGENEGVILVSIRPHEIEQPAPFGDFGGGQIASGRHVVIEVRDTGCGMNDDTKSRVFDPFFTTKFMGRGLGDRRVLAGVRPRKLRDRRNPARALERRRRHSPTAAARALAQGRLRVHSRSDGVVEIARARRPCRDAPVPGHAATRRAV